LDKSYVELLNKSYIDLLNYYKNIFELNKYILHKYLITINNIYSNIILPIFLDDIIIENNQNFLDDIDVRINIIDENIILPSPPDDEEKYLYIKYKNHILIYIITTLLNVSNLSSIILLIIISNNIYYLLIISLLYFLYNFICYYIYIIKIGLFNNVEIHKTNISNITFFPKLIFFYPYAMNLFL